MRLVLQAALAATMFTILADGAVAADGPRPLFASDSVLTLTLKGPIQDISRNVGAKPVPGLLTVTGAAPESLPIQLSTRGITRRKKEICAFPPLRVEFTQKPGKTSLFRGQKRLKLVTHCQASDRYQQDTLLEYAIYKLYNALTPAGFDARLAKIDYVDEGGRPIVSRYGFFLEDVSDVADRNGLDRLRGVNHITISQLDPAAAARFAVFEYMISNLDWAMTASPVGVDCCHNSRLIGAQGATTGLIPLPYDFDYSGLINAPYAVPPENIPVANVRVRRYRGFCAHNEQAQTFIADLLTRRAALFAILDSTPQLSGSMREQADDYLNGSFDQINTPAHVADLMKSCLR